MVSDSNIGERSNIGPVYVAEQITINNSALQIPEKPDPRIRHIRRLPYSLVDSFTGRESLLASLHGMLSNTRRRKRAVVLHGLGGVGKTQTALAFANRYQSEFDIIWGVRASNEATLYSDIIALGTELGLEQAFRNPIDNARTVVQHLESLDRWLLFFDAAEGPASVAQFIPRNSKGSTIVTSRNQHWGEVAAGKEIPVFTHGEASSYLLKRSETNDVTGANAVAIQLGLLPLALNQAAAYVVETGASLTDYARLFESRKNELLLRAPEYSEYENTVATTWSLSLAQLHSASTDGEALLFLTTMLSSESIPIRELAPETCVNEFPILSVVGNEPRLNEAIAALRRYSLVSMHGNSISIHILVQTVVKDSIDGDRYNEYLRSALCLIRSTLPDVPVSSSNLSKILGLFPHATAVVRNALQARLDPSIDLAVLLNRVGDYLRFLGLLRGAKRTLEIALPMSEQVFGAEDFNVAGVLNNLGEVERTLGNPETALPLMQRAETIIKSTRPGSDLLRISSAHNIANVLMDLGRYSEAKKIYESNLATLRADSPEDLVGISAELNGVAGALAQIGKSAAKSGDRLRARLLFDKSLKRSSETLRLLLRILPSDSPELGISYNNVGLVLYEIGQITKYSEGQHTVLRNNMKALTYMHSAISVEAAYLGEFHHQVADRLVATGAIYAELLDFENAANLLRRAVKIRTEQLGEDHPKTIDAKEFLLDIENST